MRLPLLILHITAGIVGLLSGAVAISFRKGSRRHALAGNVFVISMLCNASAATFLAYMKHQTNNFFGGMLSFYMVSTAWATARRRDGETGILDWIGFLFALSIGVLTLMQGVQRATGRIPVDDGVPAFMGFFMGSVILLAALGDLRMLLRGITGPRRIARHLWRMCFGWFIATGSFFMGQQQVFPVWLRGSPVLMVLAVLPLLLLIFWLVRVRFTAYRRTFEPAPATLSS
jgi:uncharacterized membrane protein